MTPLDVETRARDLLEFAKTRPIGEDARVECKASWVGPGEFAPQLSAMANAARGEPVFILIGVNRDGSICGAPPNELADWLQRLEACFDEVAPRAWPDVRINFEEGAVHVVAFDTSAPPYVVKQADRRLVQVRRGTRTADAFRSDLLRMLVPATRRAHVEPLEIAAFLGKELITEREAQLRIEATFHVAHPDSARVVFPAHLMDGFVELDEKHLTFSFFKFSSRDRQLGTIHAGQNEILIDGSGTFLVSAYPRYEEARKGVFRYLRGPMHVLLNLRTPFDDRPFTIECELAQLPDHVMKGAQAKWVRGTR